MRTMPAPTRPVLQAAAQSSTQNPTAAIITKRGAIGSGEGKWQAEYQDWQPWARRYARQIGAASFSAGVISDCAARCILRVEQKVGTDWEPLDDPRFDGIMDTYANPLQVTEELVRLHAWHYQVAGEMLQTQRDGGLGVEYGIYSTAAAEWDKPEKGQVAIKLVPDGKIDAETAFAVPRAQCVRFWLPDQEWQAYAWSPMAASIDDLHRLRALSRYAWRTAESALAMNGLLWAPGEAMEAPSQHDEDMDEESIGEIKNAVEQGYYDAANLRLRDDDDVAAVAPHLVYWDKEYGEPKWIRLGDGLDSEGIAHRKEALEDFARGSNLPVTTVLGGGVGDANHWSEWLASDKFFGSGVAPTMDRITHLDLTRTFLWPRAKLAGFRDDQLVDLRVGYDPSPVIIKPDRSNISLQLNRSGLLANEPTLEAAGYTAADAMPPGPEQDWLLKVLGGGAAGPPGAPGGSTPGVPGMPATQKSYTKEPPERPGLTGSANGNGHVPRSRVAAILYEALDLS